MDAFIEIKPSLGDDFPAVLRQMNANAKHLHYVDMFLVIDQFTAIGATFEQVKKVFNLSGFRLLTFAEIEGR